MIAKEYVRAMRGECCRQDKEIMEVTSDLGLEIADNIENFANQAEGMGELKKCPFCGEEKELQILNQGDCVHWDCHYNCDIDKGKEFAALAHSWFVNCPVCGACGPMFYAGGEFGEKTDDECKELAIEAWNRRCGD